MTWILGRVVAWFWCTDLLIADIRASTYAGHEGVQTANPSSRPEGPPGCSHQVTGFHGSSPEPREPICS